MTDWADKAIKFWKVEVSEKSSPEDEIVWTFYLEAKQKRWAERMAVIAAADAWGYKTSDLVASSEEFKGNNLRSSDFRLIMGELKEGVDEPKED